MQWMRKPHNVGALASVALLASLVSISSLLTHESTGGTIIFFGRYSPAYLALIVVYVFLAVACALLAVLALLLPNTDRWQSVTSAGVWLRGRPFAFWGTLIAVWFGCTALTVIVARSGATRSLLLLQLTPLLVGVMLTVPVLGLQRPQSISSAQDVRGLLLAGVGAGVVAFLLLPLAMYPDTILDSLVIQLYKKMAFVVAGLAVPWVLVLAFPRRANALLQRWEAWFEGLEAWLTQPRARVIVLGLMALYTVVFVARSLHLYHAYTYNGYEMLPAQAVWNSAHGHLYAQTIVGEEGSILAGHALVALPVFVPFLLLWQDVRMLLITQTALLALGALPVGLLARKVTGRLSYAVLFALLYLLYPALGFLNLAHFRVESLATVGLLFAFWFIETERPWLALPCLALVLLTKQQFGLVVAMYGLYIYLYKRRPRLGLAVTVLSVAWVFVAVFVLIPAFRAKAAVSWDMYSGFLPENWPNSLDLGLLGLWVWKVWFVPVMLLPLAFTPLARPELLALALPAILYNLASYPWGPAWGISTIYGHHVAEIIPGVFIAGILGTGRLLSGGKADRPRKWGIATTPANLALMLLYTGVLGFLLDNAVYNYTARGTAWVLNPGPGPEAKATIEEVATYIPPDASLVTNGRLAAHLMLRETIYSTAHLPTDASFRPDYVFGEEKGNFTRYMCDMLHTGEYEVVFYDEDIVLLCRQDIRCPDMSVPPEHIRALEQRCAAR
jgi:uncharacterized membrane protein